MQCCPGYVSNLCRRGLHEQLLPPHEQRGNQNYGTRRDSQNVDLAHTRHDGVEDFLPGGRVQCLQELGSRAGDGANDRVARLIGQNTLDAVAGLVEEDGVGDGQGDGRAEQLTQSDEADGFGNLGLPHLGLCDGEAGLDKGAAADAGEDGVAVDARCGRVLIHGIHERLADDGEDAAEEEPWGVPSGSAHDGAVGDAEDDQHHHVWEEVDACRNGGGIAYELVQQGNEVDGDEDGCAAACGGHVHQDH